MKTKNFKFKSMALVLFALVLSSNVWGTTYTKATSLKAGDQIVLVCEAQSMELTGISTTGTKYGLGTSYTTSVAGTYVLDVVAGSETGSFSFKTGDNYLRWNSGNSLDAVATSVAKNSSWMVTFDASGNATIKNANDATRVIWWNVGSPRFACYTDKSDGKDYNYVQIYKIAASCTTNPSVSAGAISGATTSSLTFNCAGGITSLGSTGCSITEYGYVYGTSSNPTTSSTKYKVGESYTTTGTAFAAYTANGLNCGTTYYMRPYAINGNGPAYGAQAILATSACLVDHFIDNIQETTGYTGDGKAVSTSFTKASITLSDKDAATSGNCEEVHYHFVGWVTEADRSAGNVDAEHIVNFQDSGNTPTGTTYYAVWAAEEQ